MLVAGVQGAPPVPKARLLSDNGCGLRGKEFSRYVEALGLTRSVGSPYRRQANGKIERYRECVKGRVVVVVHTTACELAERIGALMS